MADIRVEHVFECSADVFWERVFFNSEFNRRMYLNELQFSSWRETERRDEGDTLFRVVELTPPLGDLPAPLKRLIGNGFGYREEGTFDKLAKRYRARAIPNRLADKLSVRGEMWCEPLDENRCRRIFAGKVTAKVFGIGPLLESRIVSDMRASYDGAARCTREFLAGHSVG